MDPQLSKKIDRYLDGTATEGERREVEAWFEATGEDVRPLYDNEPQRVQEATERTLTTLQQRIADDTKVLPVRAMVIPVRRHIYRYVVAASILLAVTAGSYFALRTRPAQGPIAVQPVLPGTGVALLKTAGGKVIALNGANGLLTNVGQAQVLKNGDTLAYHTNTTDPEAIVYDTLHIPAGGRPYSLRLADGSRVLLNAATTLRFPENMTKHNRGKLELITGEIYAEVVHNPSALLTVQTPTQVIEDIGTKFDVSAYPEETVSFTVLVEGSVKVNGQSLSPGEQASSRNGSMVVEPANMSVRTAWVNGLFYFDRTPLREILREVARSYDMQVVYQGNSGNEAYSGIIGRGANLQHMLSIIGAGDVHCRIEGRKLIILP